jgi:hypothetical protein
MMQVTPTKETRFPLRCWKAIKPMANRLNSLHEWPSWIFGNAR